ncbi:saccharopine dehydrogenase NADP-binding domain-containing protein [soil metagenome]
MASSPVPYDLVLVGATGFTGGLTAAYLADHVPAGARWAIAGRDAAKLERVATSITGLHPPDGQVVVDVGDATSLASLVGSGRVVASTVGPYLHHGEALVAACAAAGTDYLDITGEPEFVDRTYLDHHSTAVASGARLLHCCGFDSIPHDLGAFFTVQQLPEDVPLAVDGFVRAGGRPSGGTFHSAINAFSRLRQGAATAKARAAAEPDTPGRTARAELARPGRHDGWTLPMPTIDPEIVARSARALSRYGPDFTYRHHVQVDHLGSAVGLAVGLPILVGLAQLGPTRNLLLGRLAQGDGPTEEQRDAGWFEVTFEGRGGGFEVRTKVSGGDPGYTETAKMLGEATLCIAFDDLPATSGQVTTAQACGQALVDRLQAAGITFEVLADG